MPQSDAPADMDRKTAGFTEEEQKILEKARAIIRSTATDVTGLQEGISRYDGKWFVVYRRPGKDYEGGGWSFLFAYPSGEFLTMGREQ